VERLFLLHQGGLGDFILSLPAVLSIIKHHQISADLWTYSQHIPLLKYLPCDQSITGRSADDPRLAALYVKPSTQILFPWKYDLSYVFGRKKNDIFLRNLESAAGGTACFISTFPPEGSKTHVSDHQAGQLEECGVRFVPEYPLFQFAGRSAVLSRHDSGEGCLELADRWLQDHGIERPPLICHFGSGSRRKNWPLSHFLRLLEWWEAKEGIPGLLIAGPAEEETDFPLKIPMARNLSLDLLAAILVRSYGYVGNDSGITHLAAAVGAPTLALFGPTEPATWAPRGPRVLVLKAGDEMNALEVDYVIEQAENFYHQA
jgi:hypothetical protein